MTAKPPREPVAVVSRRRGMFLLDSPATTPERSVITWHRGSLLPHASLWHTLHRIVAMNAFTMAEFNELCDGEGCLRASTGLLHNRDLWGRPGLQMSRLAQLLGEPVELFASSDIAGLGGWAPGAFRDDIRVCLECLGRGYHSVFTSLKSLERCPVHRAPLVGMCPCGKPLGEGGAAALFARPGTCACGNAPLFTRALCRVPSLDRAELAALDGMAQAFDSCARFVAVSAHPQALLPRHACTRSLRLVQVAVTGAPVGARPHRGALQACGGLATREALTVPRNPSDSAELERQASRAAAAVFGALDRYLRQHVLGADRRLVAKMVMSCDADEIARMLERGGGAILAWTYALWQLQVTMPPRRQVARLSGRYCSSKAAPALRLPCSSPMLTARAVAWTLEDGVWVSMLGAATGLLDRWRRTAHAAQRMASSGEVYWSDMLFEDDANPPDWVACVPSDGRRWFQGQLSEGEALRPAARLDKPARVARDLARGEARARQISHAAPAWCLFVDPAGRWSVRHPTLPRPLRRGGDVHRLRLMGVPTRPRVWLTVTARGFHARLEHIPVEVMGQTRKDAFDQLRAATRRFLNHFGGGVLREDSQAAQRRWIDAELAYLHLVSELRILAPPWCSSMALTGAGGEGRRLPGSYGQLSPTVRLPAWRPLKPEPNAASLKRWIPRSARDL